MGIVLSGSRPKWESAGPQGLGGNRAAHRRAVTACACAGPGGSLPLRPVHAPAAPGQPPPPVSRAQSLTCAGGRSGRARAARCIAAAAHRTARRDRAPRCDARVALRSAQPERRAFPHVLCRLHPPVPSALVQACAAWPTITQCPPHLVSSHSVTIQKQLWSSTPVTDRGILICARLASPGERMCAPYVFPQCLQTRSARLCAPRWRTSRSMMRTRHVARPATAAGHRRRPPPARILPAGWAPWPRGRSGSVWDACILCAQGGAASALRRGEATMRAGHRRAMQRSAALQPVDGADWHHARASISRSAAPSSRERRAQRAAGCSARHPANLA